MLQSPATSDRSTTLRLRILVGIAFLCLLTVLLVPTVRAHRQKGEIAATGETMNTAITAIQQFADDNYGRYPTTRESLGVLCSDSADPCVGTSGTYLKATPVDAWGNELLYWCPGTFNRETFDISSAGPDGVFGNSDDITNWDQ